MKKNNLKKAGGLLLILMILTAGCDKKENEVVTYEKEGNDYVEMHSNKNEEIKEDEEIVEDSNINSNEIVSNSNTTNTSNTIVTKKITYSMTKSKGEKESALIRAKENGKVIWEYKTGTYEATELDNFKLYAGKTYVYVAEGGIVKALNKNTGKVVWKSSSNVGLSTDMLELNGKLYAVGSYQKGLSILNVDNGKLIDEVSIKPYLQPSNLKKVSDNVISFQAGENVNHELKDVTIEYNISKGKLTKISKEEIKNEVTSIKVVGEVIDSKNLVVVKAYNKNNKLVWSYVTSTIYRVGSSGPEWYDGTKNIYVNDNGELVALDKQTGKKIWTTTNYEGRTMSDAVEINGKLCIIGDSIYQVTIIDLSSGRIIKNLVSISELDPEFKDMEFGMIGDLKVAADYVYFTAQVDTGATVEKLTFSFDPIDYSIDIINQ